ncbi:hypothetical protein KAH27_01605 [bacterium]|nr:hypothetical protein [bacterium]
MKKILSIAICSAIVIAAVVYAAKPLSIDTPQLKAYIKTKAAGAAWMQTNDWFVFTGYDAKSQIQIVDAQGANLLINDIKLIKQKGKVSGNIENIIMGTSATPILDPANPVFVLSGNDKLSIKLKGVNVGTVLATKMKMVLVNGLDGLLAGTNPKGVKVMAQDGDIAGASAANRAVIGTAIVPTMLHSVKAKKGMILNVDATEATPAKAGKTKWTAKIAGAGDVQVKSLADWSTKNKNVTLVEPVVTP